MQFKIVHQIKKQFKRGRHHFFHFWPMVLALTLLLVASYFTMEHDWATYKNIVKVVLCFVTLLLCWKPMNAVYGLMGTSGSIRLFFINFILITFVFASVYHYAFFRFAGISYDVNQPHIDFQLYANTTKANPENVLEKVTIRKDTVYLEHHLDSITFSETVVHTTTDTLHYQKIGFWQVWRSTILTTLTQESADLLTIATVHNEAMDSTNVGLDKEKSELFEWILIFHIIIS